MVRHLLYRSQLHRQSRADTHRRTRRCGGALILGRRHGHHFWRSDRLYPLPDHGDGWRYPDLSLPVASQFELILERLERVCSAVGTGLDILVQLRVFLSDLTRLGEVLPVWRRVFGSRGPSGTALGVGPLLVPKSLLVADAIAYVPDGAQEGAQDMSQGVVQVRARNGP